MSPSPFLWIRIFPILMPLQQFRSAVSIASPLLTSDTPQMARQKSTPMYRVPVGVSTDFSVKGRSPSPASTTTRMSRSA